VTVNSFEILNTTIHAVQPAETLNVINAWSIEKESYKYIVSTNANNIINAVEDTKYSKVMLNAFLSLPDGVPFLWFGRKKGFNLPNRCGIQEIMESIYELSNQDNHYRHYFYGNTEHVLNEMKINLVQKYPNLNIVGAYSPPFRALSKEEDEKIINDINNASPDFLWVSLGCPKQEEWMYDHRKVLNPMIASGAGAVFNFLAGETKRAPRWIQYLGLEWLYRLFLNPKKLWRRYLVKYPKFIYLFCKHHLLGVQYK